MRREALGVAALVAALGGCVLDDDRPARWSVISDAIIQPSCGTAACHSALAETAGVVLDTREAGYDALVVAGDSAGPFVRPGDADSPLLYLLRGDEVERMPPDAPLPPADIALIEAWILAGAEDD